MHTKNPFKKSLLCLAISSTLFPLTTVVQAQEAEIEEVIVTGSYIRRSEGFIGSSQITVLDAEDLKAEGTLNMGEVVQGLAFVNGASSAITNTIQGTNARSTNIDLRGLGPRSTLTLIDGKRLANENVIGLIPTIAIQRMDIVADGSAALYGNEAVAGVVNFIPYKTYDGLKVDVYHEQDGDRDYDEQSVQMLWGGDVGGLDVVFAGQFHQNSRLGWDERPDLAQAGLTLSSNAPGNYYVPDRDAAGLYTGTRSNIADPNCAPASQRQSYRVDEINNPFGALLGGSCYFDFGDTRSYREPAQDRQLFTNVTWDFSEDTTFSLQAFNTRLHHTTYESTSNPGNSRVGELPAIRGEIPGNPFRAVDADGNALFGVDANGDGIPDRGTDDLNNDGTFDALVSGTADNGIPLFEDVAPRTLRPINKTHTRPNGFSSDMDNTSDWVDRISRYSLQADFAVPGLDGWRGMASWTQNTRELTFDSIQNYDIEAMKDGLNCDVLNDRDSCYNPFFVVDQANNNSLEVMNAIAARGKEVVRDDLDVLDIVINGEIPLFGFELPGGPVGAAIGYQWRNDKYRNTPAHVELAGDTWIGTDEKEFPTSGSRRTSAYFVEFSVPVLSNLDLEIAARHEDFSTGQKSTDPKFGVTYAPTDWLTLRATQGDAFIAPTLQQILDPATCGLSTVTDKFSAFSAFTTACGGGNPDLENESSKSKQLGFDLNFGDFDFSVTWNETDFKNRITTITGQLLMDLDFIAFQNATGFAGDGSTGNQPTLAQLQSWIANPASNKDIIRDPNDPTTILQVNNTSTTNAETVKVNAYDIQANYNFGFDGIGDFRLGLTATFIDHFFYQEDPTQPIVDGAGLYNDGTAAAPNLPEWKANLRLGWVNGNHAVSSTAHFIKGMPYDGPQFGHIDFFANTNRPQNMTEVKDWTDMDIAYTYTGFALGNGEAAFTLGARNVFDRDAQRSPEFAGVIGELQDPLGRVIYGRMVYDF